MDEAKDGGAKPAVAPAETAALRRFGDDEVRRILAKAAELQEHSAVRQSDGSRGLTLAELREIAGEVGIDPRFVELAVSDVDTPPRSPGGALVGGPFQWHFHTALEGEIDDSDRERILQAIRAVMAAKGDVDEVFGRMEWSNEVDGGGPVVIGISSREGTTEVDVSAVKSTEVGLIHGLGVSMGGVLGGVLAAAVLGITGPEVLPWIGLSGGVSFGLARLGWRARSRWWERRLRRVLDRISAVVEEVADRSSERPDQV